MSKSAADLNISTAVIGPWWPHDWYPALQQHLHSHCSYTTVPAACNTGFTLHDFQSRQIAALLTLHDCLEYNLVAVVCILHNWSTTGGHTLHNFSVGRITNNSALSINYASQQIRPLPLNFPLPCICSLIGCRSKFSVKIHFQAKLISNCKTELPTGQIQYITCQISHRHWWCVSALWVGLS